ncbi:MULTISPECIES: PepSY domain-containing protein [Comamonas]|uniref:PepSY domain-containing protein n=1 Tax=Comamonas TaxID=283 RepID=UPI0012CE908C|nr:MULTISPECIES: PepSY domain-containing protein [Comamonas]MEB5966978.1 PepSY domain-containing protein [Comamonas testosteroni]MPS95586.1 PepSY domain-containing protein [Comamonas sp.]
MWTSAHAKRLVFLVHRWTAVAACVPMSLWVFSGVVMLFVGYPKLLPTEHLRALPSLSTGQCCLPVEAALKHSPTPEEVQQITLTTIAGRPSYRLRQTDGTLRVVDATTGVAVPPPDDATVLRSARAFVPGANAVLQGRTRDDRWTHSAQLNPHRPLIKVQMDDSASSLLYISSSTGEVVMDAPRHQRYWNYVGAWLHWVYMFRDGSRDPVWSWLVIGLSALGTLSAIAGTFVGLWRWRFTGRYKSGSKTPYREFQMRWHHITGLVFGAVMISWIFSGLMSMNPLGLFSPQGTRPDLRAYQHAVPGATSFGLSTHQALTLLDAQGFDTREVEWKWLNGQPYLLAFDGAGDTRVLPANAVAPQVERALEQSLLEQAAQRLLPFAIRSTAWLNEYDAYYYRRGEASMYSGTARDLPVLRLQFDDPGRTLVYLSPGTGDVVLSLERRQRAGRWLFNFLHSWDLPWMLRQGWPRDAVLVVLSIGALALALTGMVLGYRRLKLFITHQRRV